ncbi:unnamed protein product [Linum trigynum]|uniref:CCHC-type domain-containing protein n=1 Tax=Linum trigynum TaxID=586398 RepID=A0AAV2EN67_9ROSI
MNVWTFVGSHDMEQGSFNGEPELKVSADFKERLCAPWKKTLVLRLLGRSMSYAHLCSQLRWKWRPLGSLDIMDLNNQTFLATFSNDQDYLHTLTGGPWTILDHYLVVHQWSPNFRTSDKPFKSVVAWVQLPELPFHFYHREVLFALGNLLGHTIKIDYHTEQFERGKFTRLAVELDMTKPLATRIRLDWKWQQVVYENLPHICFECGRIGHTIDQCAKKMDTNARTIVSLGTLSISRRSEESSQPPAGYGPWMQVTRKARKPTRKAFGNPAKQTGDQQGKGGNPERLTPKNSHHGKADLATVSNEGKGKNLKLEQKKEGDDTLNSKSVERNEEGAKGPIKHTA